MAYALQSGVSPSSSLDGLTPLHAACASASENCAVVKFLLENGADPNIQRGTQRRGSSENKNRIGGGVGVYTFPISFIVVCFPEILILDFLFLIHMDS